VELRPAAVTAKDVKTFKLKARGDVGAGKTELLTAFARMLREQFGMTSLVCEADHHLIVTATKAQRNALYEFNRRRGEPQ
jgi:Ni2+-binding GTPase involved in maturation of urease and hydrogenase